MRIVHRLIHRSQPVYKPCRWGTVARVNHIATLEIPTHNKLAQEVGLIEVIAVLAEEMADTQQEQDHTRSRTRKSARKVHARPGDSIVTESRYIASIARMSKSFTLGSCQILWLYAGLSSVDIVAPHAKILNLHVYLRDSVY